jgi:hypothetical protein
MQVNYCDVFMSSCCCLCWGVTGVQYVPERSIRPSVYLFSLKLSFILKPCGLYVKVYSLILVHFVVLFIKLFTHLLSVFFPFYISIYCLLFYLFFHFLLSILFHFPFITGFPSQYLHFCYFLLNLFLLFSTSFSPFVATIRFFVLSLPYLSLLFFHFNLTPFFSFFVSDLPYAVCFIFSWHTQHLISKITNTSHVCLWASVLSSLSYIYVWSQCTTSFNNQHPTAGTPFRSQEPPCGIRYGQSGIGIGTGFNLRNWAFSSQ